MALNISNLEEVEKKLKILTLILLIHQNLTTLKLQKLLFVKILKKFNRTRSGI